MISKDRFVKYMKIYQEYEEGLEALGNIIDNLCPDSYFMGTTLSNYYVDLLADSLDGLSDYKFDVMTWWMLEKDFGSGIRPGDFMRDGFDIQISTPEELYDWLINPDAEEGEICRSKHQFI